MMELIQEKLFYKSIPISKDDTIESLMEKIHKAEHLTLIKALQKILLIINTS